jgi:hypothetical protein
MSSTTITRGNSHETFYIQPSITPSAVSANTTDIVAVLGYNGSQTAGIIIAEADCLTANVLSIQFGNVTGLSATPASGVYTIQVTRLEGPAPTNAV